MKIAEKKAYRSSVSKLEEAVTTLNTAAGFEMKADFDLTPVETYDFEALGKSKADVLESLGNVASRIVEAMGEIAKDEDYKEALADVKELLFVPAADANGNTFDYDKSVSVDGAKMQIDYAPLAYMHGGYERSIKDAF